jgi:hypothetical protein
LVIGASGPVGFSINGGRRNVGYVGQSMAMSRNGTPFRGQFAYGSGGSCGKYKRAEPVFNASRAIVLGDQYKYIKPSVLSTKGMLEKKYKWIHNGQYPNYWVQPVYGNSNLSDNASQWLYIQNKAAANTCNIKVNNIGTYEGHRSSCGPTLCTPGRSTAGFKYNDMARNAPYTKTLGQPVSYAQYNLYLTRGCNNPVGPQKPFPFAVQTGSSQSASGTSITSFATGCNNTPVYVTPPSWYTAVQPGQEPNLKNKIQTTLLRNQL